MGFKVPRKKSRAVVSDRSKQREGKVSCNSRCIRETLFFLGDSRLGGGGVETWLAERTLQLTIWETLHTVLCGKFYRMLLLSGMCKYTCCTSTIKAKSATLSIGTVSEWVIHVPWAQSDNGMQCSDKKFVNCVTQSATSLATPLLDTVTCSCRGNFLFKSFLLESEPGIFHMQRMCSYGKCCLSLWPAVVLQQRKPVQYYIGPSIWIHNSFFNLCHKLIRVDAFHIQCKSGADMFHKFESISNLYT